MLGCESAATARASRVKRCRSALGPSVFTATRRPSSVSSASHTALMAPRPSGSISLYRPAKSSSAMPSGLSWSVVSGLPTIDEALAIVLAQVRPLEAEPVPVDEAAGRWSAGDAIAGVDLPPFDSSAMDGYAVRSADTPGVLRL